MATFVEFGSLRDPVSIPFAGFSLSESMRPGACIAAVRRDGGEKVALPWIKSKESLVMLILAGAVQARAEPPLTGGV